MNEHISVCPIYGVCINNKFVSDIMRILTCGTFVSMHTIIKKTTCRVNAGECAETDYTIQRQTDRQYVQKDEERQKKYVQENEEPTVRG